MAITTVRKLIGLGIASLALVGSASGTAAVADSGSATSRSSAPETRAAADCPSGWFCVWPGRNYTGRMQKVEGDNADLSPHVVFNGRVLSYYNHGNNCDVTVYGAKNYSKTIRTVKRGAKATAPAGGSPQTFLSNKWVNCA